jgi:hypothetical protein
VATHSIRLWALVAVVMMTTVIVGTATRKSRQSGSADESATDISSNASRTPIFSIDAIAVSPPDLELAGREVSADGIEVTKTDRDGFWVSANSGKREVLVIPAEGSLITVRPGESVDIHGDVRLMRMTKASDSRTPEPADIRPYVYAYTVRPAW